MAEAVPARSPRLRTATAAVHPRRQTLRQARPISIRPESQLRARSSNQQNRGKGLPMTHRMNYASASPEALRPLYEAGRYLRSKTTLETSLLHLVNLRASQMNGCAFCIAMHWREAKEDGLGDDQLHGLLAWREAGWYSDRERAALAWT